MKHFIQLQFEFAKLATRVKDMTENEKEKYWAKHDMYGYHSTPDKNIESIKKEGLIPKQEIGDKYTWFAKNPDDAEAASNTSWPDEKKTQLRVKLENIKTREERNKLNREFHTNSTIDPKHIEQWDDKSKEWKQLSNK